MWEAKYSCTYRTFQIFKPPLSRYKQTLVASVTEEENTKSQSDGGVCVLGIRHITYLPFHYHGNQSAGELKPNKSFLKMKEFIEITKYVLPATEHKYAFS